MSKKEKRGRQLVLVEKQPPVVLEADKSRALQSAIYNLTQMEKFYGYLLQQFTMKYTTMVPTAGITFNKKVKAYEIYINPHFFVNRLNNEQRTAVLQHEIMHFTNKHLFRLPFLEESTHQEERIMFNIAGDMAINQYIKGLPKGCPACEKQSVLTYEAYQQLHPTPELKEACPGKCINYEDWKKDDGTIFPKLETMEVYYNLIKKELEKQTQPKSGKKEKSNKQGEKAEGEGEGAPGGDNPVDNEEGNSHGFSNQLKNKEKRPGTKGNVPDHLENYKPFDIHDWVDGEISEDTKKEMLDEAKQLLKRTIEKTSFSHSTVPLSIQDLLQEIEALAAKLNYKQILKSAIKKHASCSDRESTWKRANKRYGVVSPGTKLGQLPRLALFNDSSGSISVSEQNEYLRIMDEFLRVGVRDCLLGFWHTSLYHKQRYKRGQILDKSIIQGGGTDVSCVLADIKKNNYDLSIILTDGYYDNSAIKPTGEVIFIISKNGNMNHPLKHLGKTIALDNLK